jgi:CelD/BcsL family acetyltransferase involved in cellulose biosynthesis
MLTFERIPLDAVDWKQLDSLPDRTAFQTQPWLTFVTRTQSAEPVVAALRDGSAAVGYFTGLIVQKHGFRILGSPFPGWTTAYMGFNLLPGISRRQALEALVPFAFDELSCIHLELMDRRLTVEDGSSLGFECQMLQGFEIDLTQSEEELFAAMKPDRREWVRKAQRRGVVVEEARDDGFVDDYYAQLQDVFAKQRLVPTYSKERVRALIDCLSPTGRLLRLRARDPGGTCVATVISVGMNDTVVAWGGASWRQYQTLHPNEPLQWYAIRYWKARGIRRYDMNGAGEYKRRYGGTEICVPWFRKSKYPLIAHLRLAAQHLVATRQRIGGLVGSRPGSRD